VLDVLMAPGMSLLGLLSDSDEIHVCILTLVYPLVYKYFYTYPSGSILS